MKRRHYRGLSLALLLFLPGLLWAAQNQVIKSPNDDRDYEYLQLPNGLKVLLISDPKADKAAAALTVGVGSLSNPPEREGLAHFLEHMLFLGTKKYPKVDEYAAFIKRNGGSHNAFTASNQTTYYFDIKAEKLEPALDRFAQFFIAPLFDEGYVEREKHAVHSEYQLKLKEDSRRIDAASKQSYNPKSPYARFAVGNLKTLADRPGHKVRDDLIAFYKQHYSSNIMGLAILGREPLPVLRQWAKEKFSAVPNRNVQRYRPRPEEWIYLSEQLPLQVDIQPLKDLHQLSFTFLLPSAKKYYREQPLTYIAHFIGDEGEGSLYAYLREKGWITSLTAGGVSLDDEQAAFEISMDVTEAGKAHLSEISAALFQYIELLRRRGVEAWRFDELKRTSELDFRFQEKTSASHYVTRLSGRLLDYPPQDLLRGGQVMEAFSPALIQGYLSYLRPERVAITWVDRQVQGDKIEPLYQVAYRIESPPSLLPPAMHLSQAKLALPKPNPFIPEQAVLKPLPTLEKPRALKKRDGLALWFRPDTEFGVPKAVFSVRLEIPQANDTPEHAVALRLLLDMIEDELNAYAYPAQLAGLEYSLVATREGLNILLYGYDEKQAVLLQKLLQQLRQPQLDATRFLVFKDKLGRELANKALERPYRQILDARQRILLRPAWTPQQKLQALAAFELQDLQAYAKGLFERAEVRMLAHGNLSAQEAQRLASLVEQLLLQDSHLQKVPEPRLRHLRPGESVRQAYPVDHPDSVVVTSFQGNAKTLDEQARWRLLGQMISNPFYTELRTNQQLGYVVYAGFTETEELPGLLLLVQSSAVSARELEKRMENFLKDYLAELETMSAEDFATHKAGLINRLLKKDENLLSRSERYLSQLERGWLSFDFRQRLATTIKKLSREEMVNFYRANLLQRPRRLTVYSPGNRFAETLGQPATVVHQSGH